MKSLKPLSASIGVDHAIVWAMWQSRRASSSGVMLLKLISGNFGQSNQRRLSTMNDTISIARPLVTKVVVRFLDVLHDLD